MLGEPAVKSVVHLIEDKIQKIKPRDKRWWEVDVACDRQIHIIFRTDGVGCCEDGRSCIESGDNTRFGDGDSLLFLENQYY